MIDADTIRRKRRRSSPHTDPAGLPDHALRNLCVTDDGTCVMASPTIPAAIADTDSTSRAIAFAKWGSALDAGFQIVPNVLIRAQSKLGLDALDLAILLNINLHWWTPHDLPYPRTSMIANRVGSACARSNGGSRRCKKRDHRPASAGENEGRAQRAAVRPAWLGRAATSLCAGELGNAPPRLLLRQQRR